MIMEKNEFYNILNSGKSISDNSLFDNYSSGSSSAKNKKNDYINFFSSDRYDPTWDDGQLREHLRFDLFEGAKDEVASTEESIETKLFEDAKEGAESIETSLEGSACKATVSTKKVKNDTIARRLGALGLACLVTAGIAGSAKMINTFYHNSIVNPHVISLRQNVVSPNTHRTDNGLYYFFDYDDISEYLKVEGEDFSKRLYIMVECIGQYQVDRVLDYVDGVDSVEDYAQANGFESVDKWKETEFKKLVLEKKIDKAKKDVGEVQEELDGMFSDPYQPADGKTDNTQYGGAK